MLYTAYLHNKPVRDKILNTMKMMPPLYGPNPLRKYELMFFFLSCGLIIWLFFAIVPEPLIKSPNVPGMPVASDNFDCDDSAMFMFDYFTSRGYDCTIVTGNLELENETFSESDHIWVLVKSQDDKGNIAYDWGSPCFDRQHYHGYELTYDQLKDIVAGE